MKNIFVFSIVMLLLIPFVVTPLMAQEKITKEDWQSQMASYKTKQGETQAQLTKLNADIDGLKAQSLKLDADLSSCETALYDMLGVTQADIDAFDKELTDMENRVNEMQRMSDVDLVSAKDEMKKINQRLGEMANSKIALLPRYGDRIRVLQDKLAALMKSLAKEKTYTVGTWSKNHDCLWNIAKKKDIYANAWLWPKIWQGNRDRIKDPDLIKPKWVLKIPEGNQLSKEEKSAANRYYHKKAAAAPEAPAEPKKTEKTKQQ